MPSESLIPTASRSSLSTTAAQEANDSIAFRVLTIVARPLNVPELPNIADAWALADGLTQVEAPVHIKMLEPPTVEKLRAALVDQWDVIHFDGHGAATKDGGLLAFEDEDGAFVSLPAREFAEMLSLSGSLPRLVILSACESACGAADGLAGELVRSGIPAVIGTRETVTVDWTMALVRPLYAALGRGLPIQKAFDFARPALRKVKNPISSTPSFDLPALLGSGLNERVCDGSARGRPQIERARLINWTEMWQGRFHGDFIEQDENNKPVSPPEGRKGLIAQAARALLRGQKLITLTGTGGIGKTALAAVVARRMAWRFPGGVFWIDGRDYITTGISLDAVLEPFAHIYGSDFLKLATQQKRELVRDYMNRLEYPCLIVLDNADVAKPDALRFLYELPPRCAALLTSREAPEMRGTVISLKAMSQQEGLEFLVEETGRRRNDPAWHLTINEQGEVEVALDKKRSDALLEIARLLNGHPLALMQAAALIASDGLMDTLELVRAHPAQGREIRERFDFSYEPLSESQKRLLHRLAAFAADFDMFAVESVCTDEDFAKGDEVLRGWKADLRVLRDKSLVDQYEFGSEYRRFRLHPVMRDYVRVKVSESSLDSLQGTPAASPGHESDLMGAEDFRVAQYYLALAGAMRSQLGDTDTALSAVRLAEMERLNLLAGQETATSQGVWEKAISFAYRLDVLFERTGHWTDRRQALERGLDAAKASANKREIASMVHNLAILLQQTGAYEEARRLYEQSLEIKRDLGNKSGVAISLHELGRLAQGTGDYEEARRLYEQSLEIKRDLGDKSGVAITLHELGRLAQKTGDYEEARRLYEQSLEIERDLGNKSGVATSLHQLGVLAQLTGDYEEARRLYEQSLEIERDLGNKSGVAETQAQLGQLAMLEKDYVTAVRLWAEALQTFQKLQSPNAKIVEKWFAGLKQQLGEEKFNEIVEAAKQ